MGIIFPIKITKIWGEKRPIPIKIDKIFKSLSITLRPLVVVKILCFDQGFNSVLEEDVPD